MQQKLFGSWALPRPTGGAYNTPPDPLVLFRGGKKERGEGRGEIGKGGEGKGKGERKEGKGGSGGKVALAVIFKCPHLCNI